MRGRSFPPFPSSSRRRSFTPLLHAPPLSLSLKMALFLPSPLPIGALGGLACKDARRRHPRGGTGALGFRRRRLHASSAPASRPSPLPGRVIDAPRAEVPAERPPLSSASFVAVPERTTRVESVPPRSTHSSSLGSPSPVVALRAVTPTKQFSPRAEGRSCSQMPDNVQLKEMDMRCVQIQLCNDRKTIPVEEIPTIDVRPGWKKGTKITFLEGSDFSGHGASATGLDAEFPLPRAWCHDVSISSGRLFRPPNPTSIRLPSHALSVPQSLGCRYLPLYYFLFA